MNRRNIRKKRGTILVGLDVGTTKICALVAEVTTGGMEIIAMGAAPSTGLRKGVVIDIESTVESIKKAVREAETLAGFPIRSVYVGIAGSHIKGFESYGVIGIKGREVRQQDVERAIDSAGVVYVPLDREVIHVIPTEFILDGQNGIKDPVGMAGVRLEVKVHVVTGAVSSVQNLLKCCERAGLDVIDIVLEPIASAEAVLSEDDKELGIALIDIGGGTTDIALYQDASLRHTAVLGLGGNHFTNDIAVGLRIPMHEAERIKKVYGCAVFGIEHDLEDMDVVGSDRQVRKIPRKYLVEIIQPRCEELAELIRTEIESASRNDSLSGVVLTGGASLLQGIDRMFEAQLGLPVRIGFPENVREAQMASVRAGMSSLNNPMYATGVGIIMHSAHSIPNGVFRSQMFENVFERMKEWTRNLLGFESSEIRTEQEFSSRKLAAKQRS